MILEYFEILKIFLDWRILIPALIVGIITYFVTYQKGMNVKMEIFEKQIKDLSEIMSKTSGQITFNKKLIEILTDFDVRITIVESAFKQMPVFSGSDETLRIIGD